MTRPRFSNSDIAIGWAAPVALVITGAASHITIKRHLLHLKQKHTRSLVGNNNIFIYASAAYVAFSQSTSTQLQHGNSSIGSIFTDSFVTATTRYSNSEVAVVGAAPVVTTIAVSVFYTIWGNSMRPAVFYSNISSVAAICFYM